MRGYLVPQPDRNPGLVADCETLLGLRDTLAGPTILNWGLGTPLQQWAGVQISGEPRRVTGLKFQTRAGSARARESPARRPHTAGDRRFWTSCRRWTCPATRSSTTCHVNSNGWRIYVN